MLCQESGESAQELAAAHCSHHSDKEANAAAEPMLRCSHRSRG